MIEFLLVCMMNTAGTKIACQMAPNQPVRDVDRDNVVIIDKSHVVPLPTDEPAMAPKPLKR
jgi:hypothetical protein